MTTVFCKTFYFVNEIFFFIKDVFLWGYFFKGASGWIQGIRYYWKAIPYRKNRQKYPVTGAQELFKWWRTLRDIFSWNLKICLGLISFWAPLKGCFWIFHKQGDRFDEFSISHFSSLETMYRSSRLQLFFKIRVLKNFAIFTVKHLRWSLFLIKQLAFRAVTLLKGDSITGLFLCMLQKLFRSAFYIKHLRWLLLNSRSVCLFTGLVFIMSA